MDAYFYKYDLSEENGGLIAATILDPRFKQLKFLDKDADIKAYYKFATDVIEQKFPEFARALDSRDGNLEKKKKHFLSDDEEKPTNYKNTLKEIQKYATYPKLWPEDFYPQYGYIFKRLDKASKSFLLSPATSVPVERVFSHASFQVKIILFEYFFKKNY